MDRLLPGRGGWFVLRCCDMKGCGAIGRFFFSSRRRHTRLQGDWSSDVCSSDLCPAIALFLMASSAVVLSAPYVPKTGNNNNNNNNNNSKEPPHYDPVVIRFQSAAQIGRASCRERV